MFVPNSFPMGSGWRAIVRDNAADARVIGDLERLAAAYGAEPTAQEAPVSASDAEILAAAYRAEPGAAGAASEPGAGPAPVPIALTHIRRNRTAYGVAAALLAVLALVDPVADVTAPAADPGFASPASQETPAETAAALPGPGGTVTTPPVFDALFPVDAATFSPSVPVEAPPPVAIPSALADLLDPLRIVESGYASATGGTPLEQAPPADGLPVTAAGPAAARFSYVRLAGTAPVLSLRLVTDDGASINEASAAVSACRITDPAWTGARGARLDEAPDYDSADCVKGAAGGDGTWTFDMSARTDRTSPNGFALVPSPDAAGPFQVVFSPTAS